IDDYSGCFSEVFHSHLNNRSPHCIKIKTWRQMRHLHISSVSSFNTISRFQGSIGGNFSRVSSSFGVAKASVNDPQLPYKQANLNTSNNYQAESKQSQQASISRQPSFGSRFCIALVSIFVGLIGSLFGGNALDDKRHLLGPALIFGS